ncbi:restriction endonuclease subunit S [Gephyromycinifex aptenodytis]|uniref:restriction endonuclease subunit S n=1 Tax=Gephyromycinifex aptenodytis TaxID=2716227 RepID=UPI001447AF0A|nr:restriction endonuclease subunit S [Gephyromycinifex aptenodytis]
MSVYEWSTVPFWSVARRVERTGRPEAQLLSVYREWGVIRKTDRDDNFNQASEDLSSYKIVHPGDLVLNKMKTWQGSLGVSKYDGIVSPAYFVCELSKNVDGDFIHHLLRSRRYIAEFMANSKGIRPNQWDLPYEILRQLPLRIPPLEEQRRIADFLDDRVARIDQIVAARQQQVILAKESLQSLRQKMTTTGQRSAVSERPTGIPWMPAIRADFGLWRLGHAFRTGSGTTPPSAQQEHFDGTIPWVTTSDLRDDSIHQVPRGVSRSALNEFPALKVFPSDSLLVAMYGATVGRTAILKVPATTNQACCALEPLGPLLTDYAFHWFNGYRTQVMGLASGGGQPNINQDIIRSLHIGAPDLPEQASIIADLDQVCASHKAGSDTICQSISRLQEYKQSLITAAVTGEFDVTTASTRIPE